MSCGKKAAAQVALLLSLIHISAAQSFLKLGIATTVLTGVTLMSRGDLSLIPFLMFLIAATRDVYKRQLCVHGAAPRKAGADDHLCERLQMRLYHLRR